MRSHISTASSILWVTMRMLLIGMRPSTQRSRRSVRRVSAVSTSSAEKGSSIRRILGWTTSARAKPTRWRMPPESSFGKADSKPSRPMRSIAFNARLRASSWATLFGPQTQLDIGEHGEPGKQRKALKHHGNPIDRTAHRLAKIAHFAAGGENEPGDDAQEGGFAAARAAQQADDFILLEGQRNIVEDGRARLARSRLIALRNISDFEQGSACRLMTSARWCLA